MLSLLLSHYMNMCSSPLGNYAYQIHPIPTNTIYEGRGREKSKDPFFSLDPKSDHFLEGGQRELIKYSLHHLGSQKESCHFRSLFLPILQKSKSSSDRRKWKATFHFASSLLLISLGRSASNKTKL